VYALQQAMRAIRANWIASVATITTMTLSLTILSAFSLVSLNLNQTLADLQSELEISAFLGDDADSALLMQTIDAWPEIDWVDFLGKEDALAALVENIPGIATASTAAPNPLPDTINLQLRNPQDTLVIGDRLLRLPGVTEVIDGSDEVERFLAINAALRVGGTILIVVLLSSAVFAIVNSIRAAITARSAEIEVMRLVGATRGFIRAPFLFEGLLLGLFSAVITLALIVPGYTFIVLRLSEQFPFVTLVRDRLVLSQVAALLSALAILVGLIGSAISVSQYLTEQD
jgi:cell division protein FtsX